MKKWYVMLTVALAAVLLFSACATVNGGTTNRQSRFVKLLWSEAESNSGWHSDTASIILNVDRIERIDYIKIQEENSQGITEAWKVHLIPASAGYNEISNYRLGNVTIYDRENAARLYEAMGMTLD